MYVQAKMVLGLSSATKAEELDSEDIHKKFISKLALVIITHYTPPLKEV